MTPSRGEGAKLEMCDVRSSSLKVGVKLLDKVKYFEGPFFCGHDIFLVAGRCGSDLGKEKIRSL